MKNDPRPASPHHLIQHLKVTGGFLSGVSLEFVDGLNCLIGGRGAGKTTALEFLRYGLGLMPDPKVDLARHRAIEGLVKGNLGSGRIAVSLLTKAGIGYTAVRAVGEHVQVLSDSGTPVQVSLDRDQIFGADVFSQNEIEEIAASPPAQLELLDRFRGPEAVAIADELADVDRQLQQSTVEVQRVEREMEDLAGKASEVVAIGERLRGLQTATGPDAAKITAAHLAKAIRVKQARVPEKALAIVERLEIDIAQTRRVLESAVTALVTVEEVAGENSAVVSGINGVLQDLVRVAAGAFETVDRAASQTSQQISERKGVLTQQHATQEAAYQALVAELEEEGGRSTERQALQQALAEAEAAARERAEKERSRAEILARRQALLRRVSELRDLRYAIRKGVAEKLTSQFPVLRVSVEQAADLEGYCSKLAEHLRGSGMKQGQVATRLSEGLLPTELCSAVKAKDAATIADRGGLDVDRARKVIDALGSSGAVYELETVDLGDRPRIELKDGQRFKDSGQLSTGQRCTTILPILLVQSERPLIIDQPEDNLDNAFVYEAVVPALQAVKGSRQVIFVTHNPNIPVLGEADRVFVFKSDGQHGTLEQVGGVDACKVQIEQLLEGGREAFRKRKERYGH